MQQIDHAESQLFENDENQFLMQYMQHQSCPFCSRSFFRGKLAYHLKHCSSENPMIKSNKPTPRHLKNSLSAATSYQRCTNCNSRIPSYLLIRHNQSCIKGVELKKKNTHQTRDSIKNHEISVQESILPKIKNYPSQDQARTSKRIALKLSGPKIIKIRQQLRCFRIAQQVQKIECQHCGRRFSQQASQRHIPICSLLKQKQRKQIAVTKDTKNNIKKQKIKLQGLGKSYQVISMQPSINKQQKKSSTVSIKDITPNPIIQNNNQNKIQPQQNIQVQENKNKQKDQQQKVELQ